MLCEAVKTLTSTLTKVQEDFQCHAKKSSCNHTCLNFDKIVESVFNSIVVERFDKWECMTQNYPSVACFCGVRDTIF